MAHNIIYCLKYRNVIQLEREWHCGDYTPLYYYHYLPHRKSFKYKFSYKAKKFVMYERVL